MKVPHDPEELIAIVDENDNVIGEDKRKIVHEKGLLHREAAVIILNSKNQMMVQERTDNHKLDTSVAGHLRYGKDYDETIIREMKEELSIEATKEDLKKLGKMRIESGTHNIRFVTCFQMHHDYDLNKLKIDPGEVAAVKFMDIEELKNSNRLTNSLRTVLEKFY